MAARAWGFNVVFGVAAVLVIWFLLSVSDGLLIAATMAGPVVVYLLARGRLNPPLTSPTTIVAGIFWAIGAIGYLVRHVIEGADSGAGIFLALDDDVYVQTLQLIMGVCCLVLVGGTVFRRPAQASEPVQMEWRVREPGGPLFLIALVPLIVMAVDSGSAILERPEYLLGERGTLIGGIGGALYTAGGLYVGYLYGASRTFGHRFLSVVLLAMFLVMQFSYGSRRFAMIPITFAVGAVIAHNCAKRRRGILWGGLWSALLLPIPLKMRGLDHHGLLPYLDALPDTDWLDTDWTAALNNVFVAFPIIGETAFGRGSVTTDDLMVALNPMPGSAAGWYDISGQFLLNRYTPYAGIGELGDVGWLAVMLFGLGIGLVLGWAEGVVRRHLAVGNHVFAAAMLGLSGLFALQMVQYTLRSSMRLLLYLIALEMCRRIFVALRRKPGVTLPSREWVRQK